MYAGSSKQLSTGSTKTCRERSIALTRSEVIDIRAGRKTQLRRLVDLNSYCFGPSFAGNLREGETAWWVGRGRWIVSGTAAPTEFVRRGRYGCAGDTLWVRETWAAVSPHADPLPIAECNFEYRADVPEGDLPGDWHHQPSDPEALRWRSATTMPRFASRLTLTVVQVRVERLHAITGADATAEGHSSIEAFKASWNSTNERRRWADNPYVWVVAFDPNERRRAT